MSVLSKNIIVIMKIFLKNLVLSYWRSTNYWISYCRSAYEEYYLGMTETSGNLFTLEGLSVNFHNFASTQPSSASETCITIYGSSGIYYDTMCSSKHFGVCSTIPNSVGVHGIQMQGVYDTMYNNWTEI